MNKDKEIEKINSCIGKLVYDKVKLRKAYNYYHCVRDPEQYKHIESNYGIGTPTSVGFTPLIKKHIDVLVGEYLELDPDLTVTCKDDKTISDIMRDKQLKIDEAVFNEFKSKLENAMMSIFVEDKKAANDPFYEKEMEKIRKDISNNYVSEYEIAACNILNYIKYSRDIDIKNKMRNLLTDLLVGGLAYYRVRPTSGGNNIRLEVLNPVDTFVERNHNEMYLNKSPRACIRKYMTRDQVLSEYWDELSQDAKDLIKGDKSNPKYESGDRYVQAYASDGMISSYYSSSDNEGLEIKGVNFGPDSNANYEDLLTVYEVEWIEFEDGVLNRHEGVKIGGDIYITRGASNMVTRSVSNPRDCSLSVNGLFFNDRNGRPFSIMEATMDLQD